MTRPPALAWGAVMALSVSALFVFETSLVGPFPAAVTVCATVLPAAVALAAMAFRLPHPARPDRRDTLLAVTAGVLGVWLAPFLVAAVRASDAPSGAEVLFLTSSGFGLTLVAAALLAARRFDAVRLSGALLGLVGAAGILANWERPSSFSPFMKFPERETVMLLAGVAFAVAVLLLARVVRRRGPLSALRIAALAGAAASVLGVVLFAPRELAAFGDREMWTFAAPAAVATFALLLGWAQALKWAPVEALAGAYFLPPALLTGLSFVERRLGVVGPDPIRWGAAGPGIALSVAACLLVALSAAERSSGPVRSPLVRAGRVVAAISVVLAAVALVTPDMIVSVRGTLSSGEAFRTQFAMTGAETAGGWLAACCTLLAAAWAWRPVVPLKEAVLRACVLGVALAVWLPVHTTPLYTWNRWIPPEVQQDYGTEYALRTERPVTDAWELAGLAGAGVAATLVLLGRGRGEEAPAERQEVPTA